MQKIKQDAIIAGNSDKALLHAFNSQSFLFCTTMKKFTETEIFYKQFMRGLCYCFEFEPATVYCYNNLLSIQTSKLLIQYEFKKLLFFERFDLFNVLNNVYESDKNMVLDVYDHYKANQFLKTGIEEEFEVSSTYMRNLKIDRRDITASSKIFWKDLNLYDASSRNFQLEINAYARSKEYNLHRHNEVIKEHRERIIKWPLLNESYAIHNNSIIFMNVDDQELL